MTRIAENAYFIQQREKDKKKSVKEIVRKFVDQTDGATMSGKKDACVNIGGFWHWMIGMRLKKRETWWLFAKACIPTGGMAGRDMEALAIGLLESVHDDHMRARVGQVEYLEIRWWNMESDCEANRRSWNFCGCKNSCHHSQDQFLRKPLLKFHLDAGIRTMERYRICRKKPNGENYYPKPELVQLYAAKKGTYT